MNIIRSTIVCFCLNMMAPTAWAGLERQIIEDASRFVEQKRYSQAKLLLDKAAADPELTAYERSVVSFNYGRIHLEQGKAAEAQLAFEQALKPTPTDQLKAKIFLFLALACKAQQQECYVKNLRSAEQQANKSHDFDWSILLSELGEIEYAAQNYSKAANYFQRAISHADQHTYLERRMPQEKWLQIQADVYAKLEDTEGRIDAMRQLALFYGDETSIAALRKYSGGMEPLLTDPKDRKIIEGTIGKNPQRILKDVDKARSRGGYLKAKSMLEEALLDTGLSSFERASLWNSMAQHRSRDVGLRTLEIYAYEQARRQSEISEQLAKDITMTLGTLYWVNGLYDTSIARAEERLKLGPHLPASFLICTNYHFSDRYREAITACEEYLAATEKQGKPVEEKDLRRLEIIYENSGDRKNRIRILQRLAKEFPDKGHDKRLAELEAGNGAAR